MDLFATIPSSTLAFAVFPFIESEDLLSLRATCSRGHALLHSEEESEALWRAALMRDFSIGMDCTITLRVSEASSSSQGSESRSSVFGFSPSESVFEASSAFESWKHWKKASVRYYQPPAHTNQSPLKRNLYGPCE